MIVQIHCDLPLFNLVSEEEVKACQYKKVTFLGCPGKVLAANVSEGLSELYLAIDIDQAFNCYLTMHTLFLNGKDDKNVPPLNFLE